MISALKITEDKPPSVSLNLAYNLNNFRPERDRNGEEKGEAKRHGRTRDVEGRRAFHGLGVGGGDESHPR